MFTWDANRDNTSPDTTSANITEMSRSSRPTTTTRRSAAPSPPTQRDENATTASGTGGQLPNNAGPCYHADCDDFILVDEKGMQNTVRFSTMLIYGLADAPLIPAVRMTDTETKVFLEKNNLRQPLQIAGEWRWKD